MQTTLAANGGRPCQFADGANITESCTGALCCKGSPALTGANVLYTQDFGTNADGWFQLNPANNAGIMAQTTGFSPAFGSSPGVGQVVMSGQCVCPTGTSATPCNVTTQLTDNGCKGPSTRFGQSSTDKYWKNLTAGAPNGFVTQLAMYLDTSAGNQLLQDTRIDYSVALNNINDSFVQVTGLTLMVCFGGGPCRAAAACSGPQRHTQALTCAPAPRATCTTHSL